jgi:hypothetical protein
VLFLTVDQHKEVLRRLVDLGGRATNGVPADQTDLGYASLMVCFLLQNLSAAETLLRISSSFGNEWYPVTVGYTIARTMFEVDVTAHYITQSPSERVPQYIHFTAILNKLEMDACNKHRNSKNFQWREAMELIWKNCWSMRESEVINKFNEVSPQFASINKKSKNPKGWKWSGKSIHEMASEVDHVEAYDIFYSELSSFTHGDVHLADRFIHHRPDGYVWSQKAREFDVGNVFRHAISFLACNLTLFGGQFKTWTEEEVNNCWIMITDGK